MNYKQKVATNYATFCLCPYIFYDSNGCLIASSNGLEYLYDTTGIFAVKYNNATYFYRKDAQGNIIALLDNAGKLKSLLKKRGADEAAPRKF